MIRRLMVAFAAFALLGAAACSGGEKKGDEAPTEQPESAPMGETNEAPPADDTTEEAPPEEAPDDATEDGAAEEGGDESGAEE